MMNNTMEYKGYYGSVEYSPKDEVFFGRVVGVSDHITFEGKSVDDLKHDFQLSIEDYLDSCRELGKEPEKIYKGSFNIRIKPELHKQLAIFSKLHNQTLNKSVEEAISRMVSA
ncbi:MAG: type II toxin-antitoxin system HicB family antitoxin [Synergistaceae bacterium]|nr:type II toxin-antitoxin system HicB family antitoxin [Synergistaceae bacterium]